ncbi:MAG: hypothetical protein IK127_04465 [Clostridia bacterium]|nr:hypothetical protein [Clostridia bacterium]
MRKDLICADTGEIINIIDVPSKYDLQSMMEIDHGFYCLTNENRVIAYEDITSLNQYIMQAIELCEEFPCKFISPNSIRFDYHESSRRDYVILKVAPLTPHGKLPKYPLSIRFFPEELFNGEITYGRDKTIQKVKILSWGSIPYILNIAKMKNTLEIVSIYKTVDFKDVKLFDKKGT